MTDDNGLLERACTMAQAVGLNRAQTSRYLDVPYELVKQAWTRDPKGLQHAVLLLTSKLGLADVAQKCGMTKDRVAKLAKDNRIASYAPRTPPNVLRALDELLVQGTTPSNALGEIENVYGKQAERLLLNNLHQRQWKLRRRGRLAPAS